MCLILFAWRPGHTVPLVVAANRDEFYARPALPLAEWADAPGLLAGRDLEAGGTWLGLTRGGRFAALTNIRAPGKPLGRLSRGELPSQFLQGDATPLAFLQALAARVEDYSGFNLLVGDGRQLAFLNAEEAQPRLLTAGVYGLSNATLDSPWPKLLRARGALAECLAQPDPECLLALLGDPWQPSDGQLPETGIGLVTERMLSSTFIRSGHYGTRASTALIVRADGHFQLHERSFGPEGCRLGEVQLEGQLQPV